MHHAWLALMFEPVALPGSGNDVGVKQPADGLVRTGATGAGRQAPGRRTPPSRCAERQLAQDAGGGVAKPDPLD